MSEEKKQDADSKDANFIKPVIISTDTSAFFFLPKFDSKDVSTQERLPTTFKDLDLLLNKIFNNLEETESVFMNQVKEVVERDLKLVKWKMKLEDLQQCLVMKQQAHSRIEQGVQFILNLSNDLQNILIKMEKELQFSPDIANGFKFSPDRMHMYDAVLKMNLKQRDMLQQVSDSITSMNDAIGSNPLDPVGQITRILNLHTEAFGIVERKIGQIEGELADIKALHDYYINIQNEILSRSEGSYYFQ